MGELVPRRLQFTLERYDAGGLLLDGRLLGPDLERIDGTIVSIGGRSRSGSICQRRAWPTATSHSCASKVTASSVTTDRSWRRSIRGLTTSTRTCSSSRWWASSRCYRIRATDLGLEEFSLGRRPGYQQLAGDSEMQTYGQILHSPARCNVPGRRHRASRDQSNFRWKTI